jgi:hypothetical protein
MYNFIISDVILPIIIFSLGTFMFNKKGEILWYLIFISILSVPLTCACYQKYKLIKYIKVNYSDFYRRHSDRIGGRFWLKVLKHDLESLNDEYININMRPLEWIKRKLGF